MTAVVISNQTSFGSMTNQSVGRFEAASNAPGPIPGGNNFGVQPDPSEPGKAGTDYAYAVNQLTTQWATFWAAAQPYIEQLDNGTPSM